MVGMGHLKMSFPTQAVGRKLRGGRVALPLALQRPHLDWCAPFCVPRGKRGGGDDLSWREVLAEEQAGRKGWSEGRMG